MKTYNAVRPRQARNFHADEDLPADDGERVGCSGVMLNITRIDVKSIFVTVIFNGIRMQAGEAKS